MTPQEQEHILRMVAKGRVTAAEAALLMDALGQTAPTRPPLLTDAAAHPFPQEPDDFNRLRRRYRWLGYLPLGVGLPLLLLSVTWLHNTFVHAHFFRFVLAWLPFWASILLIWLGASSQRMPWLFVEIKQRAGATPEHLFLGLPLPVRWIGWGLRLGRRWIHIPALEQTSLDEIFLALEKALRSNTPLMVRVEEEDEVTVFLG